jgi:hypothetical protein
MPTTVDGENSNNDLRKIYHRLFVSENKFRANQIYCPNRFFSSTTFLADMSPTLRSAWEQLACKLKKQIITLDKFLVYDESLSHHRTSVCCA